MKFKIDPSSSAPTPCWPIQFTSLPRNLSQVEIPAQQHDFSCFFAGSGPLACFHFRINLNSTCVSYRQVVGLLGLGLPTQDNFFCKHYRPWWTLPSFTTALHRSRSCDFRLQFLTPTAFICSSAESSHPTTCLPTRRVPSEGARFSFHVATFWILHFARSF
jgi:hypothetical protein